MIWTLLDYSKEGTPNRGKSESLKGGLVRGRLKIISKKLSELSRLTVYLHNK